MNACLPRCEPITEGSIPDFEKRLAEFREKCIEYKFEEFQPSEKHFSDVHLRYFLREKLFTVQNALEFWVEWVQWRHRIGADNITDDEISDEVSSGLAVWRGKDKAGRLCLVVTPRLLNPRIRKGNHKSFQKFLIRVVEEGIQKAHETESHQVCILYDRTGLTFEHIDPILQQFSKPTINALKYFYGPRLGALYVLHLNWWFQIVFSWLVRPILNVGGAQNKFTVFNTPQELLEVFDEEQLHLTKSSDETSADDQISKSSEPSAPLMNTDGAVSINR